MRKHIPICIILVASAFLFTAYVWPLRYQKYYGDPTRKDIDAMAQALEDAVQRINELTDKIADMESKITKLDDKTDGFASPHYSLDSRLDDIENRVSALELNWPSHP